MALKDHFTDDEIDCLIRTAGEAVNQDPMTDVLSQRQIELASKAHQFSETEDAPDEDEQGTVDLIYNAPVSVTVDLDTKEVTRVVVLDESIEKVEDQPGNPSPEAWEIADHAEWPSWEFGY